MKEISPNQREQYRLSLLRYLSTVLGRPLTEGVLLQFLRAEWSQPVDMETLHTLLAYLEGKGLIAEVPKLISPELRMWKITSEGADQYAKISGE